MFSGLIEYLESVEARDPAARSHWEVLTYPGAWALALHRVAHWLYGGDLFLLARCVNHFARFPISAPGWMSIAVRKRAKWLTQRARK